MTTLGQEIDDRIRALRRNAAMARPVRVSGLELISGDSNLGNGVLRLIRP